MANIILHFPVEVRIEWDETKVQPTAEEIVEIAAGIDRHYETESLDGNWMRVTVTRLEFQDLEVEEADDGVDEAVIDAIESKGWEA